MEWLIVLMLILIGAILVVLEILVLPGINVAGILGFISIIAGVYFGYAYYGGVTGHLILAGTVVFGFGMTWYVLRTKTWKRLSLDTRLEGTVEGIGAPMGNVKLGDMVVEAESRSGYIDAHRPVEVVKVLRNKVIVQLKTV